MTMVRIPYSWNTEAWDDGVLAGLRRGEGTEAHHQTGYIHAPSTEGEGDADGSGGAVAQPGQLLTGDLALSVMGRITLPTNRGEK